MVRALVVALLLVHSVLIAWGATRHSPVLDETAHLPVGLAIWRFGRVDLYPNNPPLVKLIAAAPLLIVPHQEEWSAIDNPPLSRPEFALGHDFIRANDRRSFWLFAIARWACLPFALLGGWICYLWARDLYGVRAGLLALALWCFSPHVVGNAQFITPDIAATSVGLSACYVFWRWLRDPTWRRTAGLGAILGLANLCKFTWLILYPLWLATFVAWRLSWRIPSGRQTGEKQLSNAPCWAASGKLMTSLVVGLLVLNTAYLFRGSCTRLGDHEFFSRTLSGSNYALRGRSSVGTNRFRESVLGDLLVPLPVDYVRGVDLQKRDFEQKFYGYLRGEWKEGGWWYYYLYGLAVKTPLGTLLLFGMTVLTTLIGIPIPRNESRALVGKSPTMSSARSWRDELVLLAPAAVVLFLVSWQTGINMFLRYAVPALPFLFIWVGKLPSTLLWQFHGARVAVVTSLMGTVVSGMHCYPHSASYFNGLVGGPLGGPNHLIDANVGWGQDLLFLKQWYDQHPHARPLGLVYFGNMDPRVTGLEFFLPARGSPSANVRCDQPEGTQGPVPGWYAVDVSFTRGMNRRVLDGQGKEAKPVTNCDFSYFQHFQPVAMAGYSICIYHITLDEANRVRKRLGIQELTETDSPP